MEFFLQLLVNGVCIGLLYGISAMGFVMIFKSSSVLNFAHGELLALGAFFFLSLVTWAQLPVYVAFILTMIGCFILGFLIERFFLRPLIGEKLIFVIMLTVGLAAMFKGFILLVWGGNLHTYPEFLPPSMAMQFGSIYVAPAYSATLIISVVFWYCSDCFLKNHPREFICAPWPITRKPRFLLAFMFAGCLRFPGRLPRWWPV